MKKTRWFLVLFCVVFAAAPALAQQRLYKSVGPDSKVVYSERPPAEGRTQAGGSKGLPLPQWLLGKIEASRA